MGQIKDNHVEFKTRMASYDYNIEKNTLNIDILSVNEYSIDKFINEINNQLSDEIKYVKISNINNLNLLNKIIKFSSNINANVLLDVSNDINHLYNNSRIMIDSISNNTKLKISNNEDIIDNNFITWAHNQDETDKLKIVNVLRKKDKMKFLKEEKIIKEIYDYILKSYSNFLSLTKEEQFNIMFDYIGENYIYDINILNYQDRYKIYAFRSRLLKLITNNNLLNIDCYTVKGTLRNNMIHEWNEVIFDNEIYNYDIIYDMKKKKDISNLGRKVIKRDTKINDILNKDKPKEKRLIVDEKIYELKQLPFDDNI